MKKGLIFLGMALFAVSVVFAVSEEVDVYAYLYRTSYSNEAQLSILQNMEQAKLTGAGEFYASALRQLVAGYRNIKNVTEKNAAAEQAIILSKLLGAEKYSQAASDLWLVVDAFPEPLVKAEAVIALGRIRATAYLPHVVRLLSIYNEQPTSDRLYGERVAFGAIIALEKYQEPDGYLPVFIASTGWYSNRVKDQAKKSLPLISDDPTPYMVEVVKGGEYSYSAKYIALQTIEASNASDEDKAKVAVAALEEGWRGSTAVSNQKVNLSTMRKLALDMLGRYKTDDESVYPQMERSYMEKSTDIDEKFKAISALSFQKTDEGTDRLAKFLFALNNRQTGGGLTRDETRLLQTIIPALGDTENPRAHDALAQVTILNYTRAIKKQAEDALKKIKS
ncbi:MAG: hypothetical protein FWH41_07105 [Treponema sp.]|nr:hypothetical protein [Treponema sp.]